MHRHDKKSVSSCDVIKIITVLNHNAPLTKEIPLCKSQWGGYSALTGMAKKRKIQKTRAGARGKKTKKPSRAIPGSVIKKRRRPSQSAAFRISGGKKRAKLKKSPSHSKGKKSKSTQTRLRRDARGRFKKSVRSTARRAPKTRGTRKRATARATRSRKPYTSTDSQVTITCKGNGDVVQLYGKFEVEKRTLEFKAAPKTKSKFPYQPSIKREAKKFYKDHGKGHYFVKTKVSLKLDDGEIVDQWFNVGPRRTYTTEKEFARELDDLNETMQDHARGYLSKLDADYFQLEQIELECIEL